MYANGIIAPGQDLPVLEVRLGFDLCAGDLFADAFFAAAFFAGARLAAAFFAGARVAGELRPDDDDAAEIAGVDGADVEGLPLR